MRTRRLALVAVALAPLGGVTCLPADTRPPPGSILLTVRSVDEPSVTTVDGWSIAIDRLLLGIGGATFEVRDPSRVGECISYSEASYQRLLDGRLPTDQKVSVIFALGQCDLRFYVQWPTPGTLLGAGVTEADKELMQYRGGPAPGQHQEGVAVDFAAIATRGSETKRVHWMLRRTSSYGKCSRTGPDAHSQPIELQSDVNLTLPISIRGVALFGDDSDPTTAVLRFDPIASADTVYGNGDGEVTLDELGDVPLTDARQFGPYGAGNSGRTVPRTLEDYVSVVLLPRLVQFRSGLACEAIGF